MSDHLDAPDQSVVPTAAVADIGGAVPVPAHEPPYYAVVFTSVRTADQSGYGETADRMEELVRGVPGFLGMDQAQTPGGLSITVGYFRDAEALAEWRTDVEHRAAQKRGRAEWYERYTLHVAKVERSQAFERSHDGPVRETGQ
ncbi:antibiotic biosynthesis monooxygenase family protein [Streptomyces phyllanthi]|uniref:antibiotic biosynthesis monooxygenase family protein n=1 Tax=Streptomyces phyllanthi TaxID=1803180 RepID=UPI001D153F4A|nr:antibiotic biosynthesis monooxygenase [Streptomyces phyllanthi]